MRRLAAVEMWGFPQLHRPCGVDLAKIRQFHRAALIRQNRQNLATTREITNGPAAPGGLTRSGVSCRHQGDARVVNVVSEVVMVPIEAIRPYKNNPRINDATVDRLVELIPKTSFNVPLVLDRNHVVVKGHARLQAAQRLGMRELPCLISDNDDETNKLDRLADNKVAEFSAWVPELLAGELAMLGPAELVLAGSLDLLQPPPLMPPVSPRADDAPFISDADKRATASLPPMREFDEMPCTRCGAPVFVPRR
jgi:hypothetical protein